MKNLKEYLKNGRKYSGYTVIPVFVPHKGCPHDCIFCNQKKISGQIEDMTSKKMEEIITGHLSTIGKDAFVEIGFYGGSFTGIEREKQRELLAVAYKYVQEGSVQEIRLSTRPDYISNEILDLLAQYGVKTIELGVQSLDEEVLLLSNRGHTAEDVYKAAELIKKAGFRLGIQTMVGLPGDDREKDISTAEKVTGIAPEIVRIYPALVIKGTYLENLMETGRYTPVSLDEAVDICAVLLEMYERKGIKVIRLGLQPTESINEGAEVSAGPFHPAFRQLVESRLALKKAEAEILKQGLEKEKDIVIYTSKYSISDVVGQKRSNLEYLKSKFGFRKIKVVEMADHMADSSIVVKELGRIRNF